MRMWHEDVTWGCDMRMWHDDVTWRLTLCMNIGTTIGFIKVKNIGINEVANTSEIIECDMRMWHENVTWRCNMKINIMCEHRNNNRIHKSKKYRYWWGCKYQWNNKMCHEDVTWGLTLWANIGTTLEFVIVKNIGVNEVANTNKITGYDMMINIMCDYENNNRIHKSKKYRY